MTTFELVIALDVLGLARLRQLHVQVYFSSERNMVDMGLIRVDQSDTFIIKCVKALLKHNNKFRDSLAIVCVPEEYSERYSIATKNDCELVIIDNNQNSPHNKNIHTLFIPQSVNRQVFDNYSYNQPPKYEDE
jgi:hypothetical protein